MYVSLHLTETFHHHFSRWSKWLLFCIWLHCNPTHIRHKKQHNPAVSNVLHAKGVMSRTRLFAFVTPAGHCSRKTNGSFVIFHSQYATPLRVKIIRHLTLRTRTFSFTYHISTFTCFDHDEVLSLALRQSKAGCVQDNCYTCVVALLFIILNVF